MSDKNEDEAAIDEAAAAEDQAAPLDEQPEAAADEDAEQAEPAADEAAEEQVDEIAEINAALRPMRHSEGEGSCDRYEHNAEGHIMVPAAEVDHMIEHGFELVVD